MIAATLILWSRGMILNASAPWGQATTAVTVPFDTSNSRDSSDMTAPSRLRHGADPYARRRPSRMWFLAPRVTPSIRIQA